MVLKVVGPNIVDENGKVVRFPGIVLYGLFKRYLMSPTGWHDLCEPILDEIKKVAKEGGYEGLIAIRVCRFAAPPNAFALDPWSYRMSQVVDFNNACVAKGFIVDWTAGDAQICFPSHDSRWGQVDGPKGIRQHNNEFCAALAGQLYVFNTCNEPFMDGKNGMDVHQVVPPPWVSAVWYSGLYYGGTWDPSADGTCINLHTDRSDEGGAPKWVGKSHESAPYLWKVPKPIFYDEPMGADEHDIPGRRSCTPRYFGILGTVIAMVSAVYFHSTAGLAGDGMGPDFSTVWPVTRRCMVEFFRGIVGGLKVTA